MTPTEIRETCDEARRAPANDHRTRMTVALIALEAVVRGVIDAHADMMAHAIAPTWPDVDAWYREHERLSAVVLEKRAAMFAAVGRQDTERRR